MPTNIYDGGATPHTVQDRWHSALPNLNGPLMWSQSFDSGTSGAQEFTNVTRQIDLIGGSTVGTFKVRLIGDSTALTVTVPIDKTVTRDWRVATVEVAGTGAKAIGYW